MDYFHFLENLLKDNGANGWLVADSLTIADLMWSEF
jgi:glutathione S-transferase